MHREIKSCYRREAQHDQVVHSIYEEMENQMREEREKRAAEVEVFLYF